MTNLSLKNKSIIRLMFIGLIVLMMSAFVLLFIQFYEGQDKILIEIIDQNCNIIKSMVSQNEYDFIQYLEKCDLT